jgi:hypothetical protein
MSGRFVKLRGRAAQAQRCTKLSLPNVIICVNDFIHGVPVGGAHLQTNALLNE